MDSFTKAKVIKETTDYAFSVFNGGNPYVEFICTRSDGVMRESMLVNHFGLIDDDHMHGYDAINPEDNRPIEIKCEQQQGVKTPGKLSGKATWGSTTDQAKVESHRKENPWMYVAGFDVNSGKCAYVVRFEFNDSTIYDNMTKTLIKRSDKTALKTSWKDFENAKSLEVLHFEPKFSDIIVKGLCDLLNSKIEMRKSA
jgi:hypothetical protein